MTSGRMSLVEPMKGCPIPWMQTDFGRHRASLRVMPRAGAWQVEFDAIFGIEHDGGEILLTVFEVGVRAARGGAHSDGRRPSDPPGV